MNYFLSCDWGTTSFRIRLADISSGKIVAEEKSSQGIAATFDMWQGARNTAQDSRVPFYLNIIAPYIQAIEEKVDQSLAGAKLIISGMVSSSIGMVDIPYASGSVGTDGSGVETLAIKAPEGFNHDVLLISGVRVNDDVMRGEETQLIGCIDTPAVIENELYIFPGTHSKHIQVINNQIAAVKTYMTGEVFELLSQKSILKNSLEADETPGDLTSFKKGVRDSIGQNLLHSIFKVRTNHLFAVHNKEQNFNYLSGLLIGAELAGLKSTDAETINLICSGSLQNYYDTALKELGISERLNSFAAAWVNEAAVRGQLKIARQLKFLS